MKKNFLKIAAMLIAAMLMVVSCTQEVAPKNEELVEVKIGVGRSSRDITITPSDGKKITYFYDLEPQWSKLDNGTPIYGAKSNAKLVDNKGIGDTVTSVSLGLVTPGLWKVTVRGEMDNEVVLRGSTTAYFTGSSSNATVFVAPVTNANATGTLSISLKMQNIESANNKIKYEIQTLGLGDAEKVTGTIDNPAVAGNVGTYEKTDITVKAGFNTITLSIPGKEGGITSTFLMLPGRTVRVTGSIYPSDFVSSLVEVKVIDLENAKLSVTDSNSQTVNKAEVPVSTETNAEKVQMFVLDKGSEYTFSFVDDTDYDNFFVGAGNVTRTYQWYLGSTAVTGATESSISATNLGIKTKEGDFAITCVTTYTFINAGVNYKIEASATEGKVRVVTPAPAPTTTSESAE